MDKYAFGNRILEKRTEKGLSQKELAALIGVSDKAVSKWETGESMPRIKSLEALAAVFGTTPEALLGGKDTAQPPEEAAAAPLPHKKEEIPLIKIYRILGILKTLIGISLLFTISAFAEFGIYFYRCSLVYRKIPAGYAVGILTSIAVGFVLFFFQKSIISKAETNTPLGINKMLYICIALSSVHFASVSLAFGKISFAAAVFVLEYILMLLLFKAKKIPKSEAALYILCAGFGMLAESIYSLTDGAYASLHLPFVINTFLNCVTLYYLYHE